MAERKIGIMFKEEKLPGTINGLTVERGKDAYMILLRDDMTETEKAAAFLHEMLHIYHNDHESGKSLDELEKERHAELLELLTYLSA